MASACISSSIRGESLIQVNTPIDEKRPEIFFLSGDLALYMVAVVHVFNGSSMGD
jgi:hypothetical protein